MRHELWRWAQVFSWAFTSPTFLLGFACFTANSTTVAAAGLSFDVNRTEIANQTTEATAGPNSTYTTTATTITSTIYTVTNFTSSESRVTTTSTSSESRATTITSSESRFTTIMTSRPTTTAISTSIVDVASLVISTARLTATTVPSATVSGTMELEVSDAASFVADSQIHLAVRIAIATLAYVPVDYVSATLSLEGGRSRRLQIGSFFFRRAASRASVVYLAYVVTIPPLSLVTVASVKWALIANTLRMVAYVLQEEVYRTPDGVAYLITVLDMSPPVGYEPIPASATYPRGGLVLDSQSRVMAPLGTSWSAIFGIALIALSSGTAALQR
ncbi:unnamed protein product [Polarella glacialis]|uniref:Uncharacterized protein n=1 Tax=Polarella glacialis TaxID=89957 RepID=A0A813KM50_POLGL|nr:unnamed protein product [Polarella glacialis]